MTPRARGHSLNVERVTHFFGGTRALDDVSLAIEPGELIALLGPSGCGKTTLLRVIAGFIRASRGEVRVDGDRIDGVPTNRRNIGIVFQNYALFPHLSVFENVAYGLRARGTPKARRTRRVAEMLALVKMEEFSNRLPAQLSGGQQQRVALARALAIEPKIILLDEPFSALDKNLRLGMQIEIKGLLREYGLTSIIVTHDQEEALSMADRIVVLNRGRIEQVDTPGGLYDRPANLFVNQFVGETNLLAGTVLAHTSGRLTIALGGDAKIDVLDPPRSFPAGAPVIVSIRPENFVVVSSGAAEAIDTTVRLTLPLGPFEVIEALTGSGEALKFTRQRSPSTPPLTPGTKAPLRIADPAGISVFPAPEAPETIAGTP